jgi:hypothetical protein
MPQGKSKRGDRRGVPGFSVWKFFNRAKEVLRFRDCNPGVRVLTEPSSFTWRVVDCLVEFCVDAEEVHCCRSSVGNVGLTRDGSRLTCYNFRLHLLDTSSLVYMAHRGDSLEWIYFLLTSSINEAL